jgi:heterodisulfide reductase subunit B
MRVSYYPGCSLKGTAKDYADSIRGCCELLNIELLELGDWNCCGATAAHSINRKAALDLAARNLFLAENTGMDILVPCPLCFNRLKTAEAWLSEEKGKAGQRAEAGPTKVWDLANFLSRHEILAKIEKGLKKRLSWIRAVCYYGCMASRPPGITGESSYENPVSMDLILKTIGLEVLDWSYKTDCCGASHLVARPDIVFTLVKKLYSEARRAGANCIVVSCQMCQANLDLHQQEIMESMGSTELLPVIYFTELLGAALGHGNMEAWLKGHFVDPLPLVMGKSSTSEERLGCQKPSANNGLSCTKP